MAGTFILWKVPNQMPFFSQLTRHHTIGFRVTASVGILVYTVLASGVPVFKRVHSESQCNKTYPCENGVCGCSNSEQCWLQCCCHSLTQRLAWARREGSRPPRAALLAAQEQGHDVSFWECGNTLQTFLITSHRSHATNASSGGDHRLSRNHVASAASLRRKMHSTRSPGLHQTACSRRSNLANGGNAPGEPTHAKLVLLQAVACDGGPQFWLMTMAVSVLLDAVSVPDVLSPEGIISELSHAVISPVNPPDPPPPKLEQV